MIISGYATVNEALVINKPKSSNRRTDNEDKLKMENLFYKLVEDNLPEGNYKKIDITSSDDWTYGHYTALKITGFKDSSERSEFVQKFLKELKSKAPKGFELNIPYKESPNSRSLEISISWHTEEARSAFIKNNPNLYKT